MQVYMVMEKGKSISRTTDVFRNFIDIAKSIEISWSTATNLKVEMKPTPSGPVEFHVRGIWPLDMTDEERRGKDFHVVMEAWRFPVWDSPTHLSD